jgi:hypothetical protein
MLGSQGNAMSTLGIKYFTQKSLSISGFVSIASTLSMRSYVGSAERVSVLDYLYVGSSISVRALA